MQRMIGPNGWEQLTALKEQLTPEDRNKIKELSTQEGFQGLIKFINEKLYNLVAKKCEADPQASIILHQFDAQKDGEALKEFFDDTAFFQQMKEFFVRIKTDKDDVIELQTFINQLTSEERRDLQRLKPTGVYPPIFWLVWGLEYIAKGFFNGFINLANLVSLGKLNWGKLNYPEGYDKTFNDYKTKLIKISCRNAIHFDDDEKVKNAMLLIPEVEDEKPSNFLTGALDMFKGSMLPDPRKLQTNWQKAIFVLLMAAALTAIIMFPYILGPLAGFAAGVTITAIFTKVSIAYTVTKIAAFILDSIIVRVFETSDDQQAQKVIRVKERVLKPEDEPKNSHSNSSAIINRALPGAPAQSFDTSNSSRVPAASTSSVFTINPHDEKKDRDPAP
jgi:hypothetical protein